MPSATSPELPSPWREFLLEVDESFSEPVTLHCLGGFVATIRHGLGRATADVDYVEIVPSKLGRNSPVDREDIAHLARTVPLDPDLLRTRYERELRPITIGNLERLDATLEMWIQAYFV